LEKTTPFVINDRKKGAALVEKLWYDPHVNARVPISREHTGCQPVSLGKLAETGKVWALAFKY